MEIKDADVDPINLHPFGGFEIGAPLETLEDQLLALKQGDSQGNLMAYYQELLDESGMAGASTLTNRQGCILDTDIGGSHVLNPLPQFSPDDDIVWPAFKTIDSSGDYGMGRVYFESFYSKQQVLYLSFGIPRFKKLTEFYQTAGDSKLAEVMTSNDISIASKLGTIAGKTLTLPFTFIPMVITGLFNGITKIGKTITGTSVNKYYEMHPRMDLYYKTVTIILANMLRSLQLIPDLKEGQDAAEDARELQEYEESLPRALQKGADPLWVLSARQSRADARTKASKSGDINRMYKLQEKLEDGKTASFNQWLEDTRRRDYMFIGFRIERGMEISDSMSNTLGESELAGTLKGLTKSKREKRFKISNSGVGGSGGFIDGVRGAMDGFIKGVGDMVGVGDALSVATKGSGYFDIPQVWQDSSFNKSNFSFDVELRAKDGTPESIYQHVLIPLAFLMAGAFPIGSGLNMYTSPYMCQAYCPGVVSTPSGMITELSIKRGMPEHGWTPDNLPLSVDLSVTIADISPMVYINMGDAKLKHLLDGDTAMKTYLNTLCAVDINDMIDGMARFESRAAVWWEIKKRTTFNPKSWAQRIASTGVVTASTALFERNKLGTPGSSSFVNR